MANRPLSIIVFYVFKINDAMQECTSVCGRAILRIRAGISGYRRCRYALLAPDYWLKANTSGANDGIKSCNSIAYPVKGYAVFLDAKNERSMALICRQESLNILRKEFRWKA